MAYIDICDALLGYPLDRVVVLDTETTGLSSEEDEILSIGIVDGNGKTLLTSYVRPTRHTSWPDAERVNHISASMVVNAPSIQDIAPQIKRLFSRQVLVVGYNVRFDLGFLASAGAFEWGTINEPFDVMREYARVHGSRRYDSGNYAYSKLVQCAAHYGYVFDAHDATEDARATAYCLRALLCDRAYYQLYVEQRNVELSHLRTTQTQATKKNIAESLGNLLSAQANGTMVVGEITRGKNKGNKRLECELDGKCVGIVAKPSAEKVLFALGLQSPNEMRGNVDISLELKRNESSYSCMFAITGPTKVAEEIAMLADKDRPMPQPRKATPSTPQASLATSTMQPSVTQPNKTVNPPVQPKARGNDDDSLLIYSAIAILVGVVMLVFGVGAALVVAIATAFVAYLIREGRK